LTYKIKHWWNRYNANKVHRKIHTSLWNFKISRKYLRTKRLLPNVCDSKKIHTLGYGFKNLYKNFSLDYGFLFFVISIALWCSSQLYMCTSNTAWMSDLQLKLIDHVCILGHLSANVFTVKKSLHIFIVRYVKTLNS